MSSVTELINNKFGGISRKNSSFTSDLITCSDCQNVELFFTDINSGIGLRTTKGNKLISGTLIPSTETVINIFETIQDGNTYFLVYTESTSQGKIYKFDFSTQTLTSIKTGLTVTGKACGCDFQQGWYDYFIFSNGTDVVYIYSNTTTHETLIVDTSSAIHLVDVDGRTVLGLGLVVFDGRLWIFNGKVLWYSKKEECRVFDYTDPDTTTSSGYIEFVKDITAIYQYLGSLAVFHKDSSSLIKTNSETLFEVGEESPGGCASYNSLIFHGTDLYFYDDTKKGVFSFQQVVNGDKTLGDNIAYDVQDELISISNNDLDDIRSLSVVTEDRNEVWFLVPISSDSTHSIVLIYDYLRQAWLKRKCQKITSINVIDNKLYSAGSAIYEEYNGEKFNTEYIPSSYTCSVVNLASDNTLKITKFPPRIAVNAEYSNNFYVKYVKNYNSIKPAKVKQIKCKSLGKVMKYDSGCVYDSDYIYQPSNATLIAKLPSSTFKALEIKFYTQSSGQSFCIKSLEFSKIKVKQV